VTDFSMPRVAVPAILLLAGGGKREGEVYVMDRVGQHAGPETPLDMLNRAEAFYPFRSKKDGEGVLLVAKARTVTLTVPDGSTLNGWATLELPQHHSRLLDYLNASTEPFFAIATSAEVHLVNRAHVLYARPGD